MNADILIDILRSQYNDILQHEVMQCIISFLIACAIAVTSIPVIINFCNLLNIKEVPNLRSAHKELTPKFGGIAIYAGVLISHFLWPHLSSQEDSYLTSLSAVGLTILFFLGLKDDLFMLDPTKKLLLQVIAVSTMVLLGGLKISHFFGIFEIGRIPDIVSIPLTIFIFIALINAINLIDGVDGLAGGVGLIASISFGTWFLVNGFFSMASLAFSLAGGLLGFLRFNFSKTSKIFMGDTGSLIVGFLLSFFAIEFIRINADFYNAKNADVFFSAPVFAVILLIVPIFDTLRVFLARTLNGASPFKADRNHMHHILLDNGMSHLQVTTTLCSMTIFNVIGYYLTQTYKSLTNTQYTYILMTLFVAYLIIGYFLKMRALRLKHQLEWSEVKRAELFSKDTIAKRIIKHL